MIQNLTPNQSTLLAQIDELLGPKVMLSWDSNQKNWIILDRAFRDNGVTAPELADYIAISCKSWKLVRISKEDFDNREVTVPFRVLFKDLAIKQRDEVLAVAYAIALQWPGKSEKTRAAISHYFGFDTPYREFEKTDARASEGSRAAFFAELKAGLQAVRQATYDQLLELVRNKGITHFVHFTRAENLEGIFKYGLLPHSQRRAMELETPWIRSDNQRRDAIPEANCLSITAPNSAMLRRKSGMPGSTWAVLGYPAEEVLKKPSMFISTNAAKGSGLPWSIRALCGKATPTAFEYMFGSHRFREQFNLAANETTDLQAEVMVLNVLEPSLLSFVAIKGVTSGRKEEIASCLPANAEILREGSPLHNKMFVPRADIDAFR